MTNFPVVELLIQVTLWSLLGLGLLLIINRYFPRHLAGSAFGLMLGIVLLTVLTCVPWPSWVNAYVNTQPVALIDLTSEAAPSSAQSTDGLDLGHLWKRWQGLMQTLPQTQETVAQPMKIWSWFTWLQIVAVVGILLGLLRLLLVMHSTHRLVSAAVVVTEPTLLQQFVDLKKSINCSKPIRLLVSSQLNVPATVGWWKPAILLPAHWQNWDADERKTVLAHELAHIQRADYLVMVLTQVITIVYWFHPLVQLISKWLRRGQELSADALAARVMGDVKRYLQSLCRLALDQDDRRLPAPARLFLSPEVPLLRRIAMLSDGSRKRVNVHRGMRWLFIFATVIAGLVIAALRSPVLADEPVSVAADTGWQRYISPGAPGCMVLQPAKALAMDSMKEWIEPLNQTIVKELTIIPGTKGMGIPIEAIECFAGALEIKLTTNETPRNLSMGARIQYLKLRNAQDVQAWIKACTMSIEKVEVAQGTYFKVNANIKDSKQGSYLLRPDERTLVFAETEQEALAWLSQEKAPIPRPEWLNAIPADTGVVTVCFDTRHALVKQIVQQAQQVATTNPLAKPFLEFKGIAACTVPALDQLHLIVSMTCADTETATSKRKQVDGVLNMLKLVQVAGSASGNHEKEAATQVMLTNLLNNAKSTQNGPTIQYQTDCSTKLGEFMRHEVFKGTSIKNESK